MFVNKYHKEAHDKLKAGEVIQSIKLYSLAIESAPNNAELLSERGVAYLHLKDYENCFTDLNTSLNLEPEYSYRYASRAYAKDFFGDLDGAIADYEKAVELDPTDALNHNNLGLLLEKKGYQKEAQANFERSDKLNKLEQRYDSLLTTIEEKIDALDAETEATGNINIAQEIPALEEEVVPAKKFTLKDFVNAFKSKEQWIEFWQFIRNGFRLK